MWKTCIKCENIFICSINYIGHNFKCYKCRKKRNINKILHLIKLHDDISDKVYSFLNNNDKLHLMRTNKYYLKNNILNINFVSKKMLTMNIFKKYICKKYKKYATEFILYNYNQLKDLTKICLEKKILNIKIIRFSYRFKKKSMKEDIKKNITNIFPPKLEELYLNNFNIQLEDNCLPKKLIKIYLGNIYNKPLITSSGKSIFPDSVKYITFGDSFNQSLDINAFPKNVVTLDFGYSFNQEIKKYVLPLKLEELYFDAKFNQKFKSGILPQSLKILKFGCHYNQPLEKNSLPNNLRNLFLGCQFNKLISVDILPSSLYYLNIGCSYDYPLTTEVLPNELKELYVSKYYQYPINIDKSILVFVK